MPHGPSRGRSHTSVVLHLSPVLLERTADELLGSDHVDWHDRASVDRTLDAVGAMAVAELRRSWLAG